ncbi:MAG: tRNA uridine-5-carboxymethylaminomethyl(34) synthesis enzyme MnmG [Phycisphaerae bacterium]
MNKEYDVIVVGAGHAGVEAAYAAVRSGARTAMVTLSLDKIGEMSCNPAIGGLAKGQIVCEIDALGGLMGEAADATGIQFRMLNLSKGPAVWGPRAQSDKRRYAQFVRSFLENLNGLDLIEGEAAEIITDQDKIAGIKLSDGRILQTRAVIITSGTFLNGIIHIGEKTFPAGRIGEKPAGLLTDSLKRLGLRIGRLKTGTCPRLMRDTIDFDRCIPQSGDDPAIPFSMLTDQIMGPNVLCHITHTNSQTHKIIRDNLGRAPLYTGQITSTGPRYCPSIEVKIIRFAGKERHQIYLEPESQDYDWIYCNGLSTSIPEGVQEAMIHSIQGLERAKIVQYGYAIEYDFVFPEQLGPDLQCRQIAGLFFAGQINGTSGYEEAAAQGLMAGVNAARFLKNLDPVILGRDQAYIGVMIDDLVTKGIDEPYRMFTSRAEFRLLLRADTAERRLCPVAQSAGILDDRRRQRHLEWENQRQELLSILKNQKIGGDTAEDWLRRPENTWNMLENIFPFPKKRRDREGVGIIEEVGIFDQFDPRIRRQIEADIKYSGYEQKEQKHADKLRKLDAVKLAKNLDYTRVPHLKRESQEKLNAVKPHTLGQASRISGITPADIMVIMIFLKKVDE